jgi:nicotinate-nucleotide adenylyltransferase
MKIGILGGSFDPPHNGHIAIAMQTAKLAKLDQVWLMPVSIHAFEKNISIVSDRLAMCALLEDDIIKVSDFEIKRGGVSFTIETLKALKKVYPENEFYWISGSSQVKTFSKWKDWQEMLNFNLLIYPEQASKKEIGEELKKTFNLHTIPHSITILESRAVSYMNISSTQIRQKVKNKESIEGMVKKEVAEYIFKHALYL